MMRFVFPNGAVIEGDPKAVLHSIDVHMRKLNQERHAAQSKTESALHVLWWISRNCRKCPVCTGPGGGHYEHCQLSAVLGGYLPKGLIELFETSG